MHPIERLRHVARASGVPQSILLRETASAMLSFADDPAALLTACRRMVSRQPESGAQVTLAARMLTAPSSRRAAWDMTEELDDDPTPNTLVRAFPPDSTVCVIGWPELLGPVLSRRGDMQVLVVHTDSSGWGMADRLIEVGVHATEVDPSGLGAAVRNADVLVLEAAAAGTDEMLAISGSLAAAAVAAVHDAEVWLAVGPGTVLPDKMWHGLIGRYTEHVAKRGWDEWDAEYETVPMHLVDKVFGPAGETDAKGIMAHASCPITPELFG